jgi:hypothetical protein
MIACQAMQCILHATGHTDIAPHYRHGSPPTHRAVPSALALTKQLPLALNATSSTSSLWPVFTDRQRPLRTSHSRADASMDPLSTKLPAGQQQTQASTYCCEALTAHALGTGVVSSLQGKISYSVVGYSLPILSRRVLCSATAVLIRLLMMCAAILVKLLPP